MLHDKWRIDARIARGGMGTVFAATHLNNGSTAAIKILHQELSRDRDTLSRFIQEGYATNQVNHPGVVRIIDDDVTEEGLAYLVMELLEGELLEARRVRKGGKLPLFEVYELAEQLLDVLAAAHGNGIVHRDVKPENIFLTRQGRLKMLDFGFARVQGSFRTEQTATGFLLGTPGFMSPEQALGKRELVDAQTDIWAVGATLFVLLTGKPVHEGESAAELLVAAANVPVRPIASLEPGLPPKLRAAVDRALAFEKRDRWPDAKSMQVALRLVPGRPPIAEPSSDRSRWGRSIPDGLDPARAAAGTDDGVLGDDIEELDADLLEGDAVDAPPSKLVPSKLVPSGPATALVRRISTPSRPWASDPPSSGRRSFLVPSTPSIKPVRSLSPEVLLPPPSQPSLAPASRRPGMPTTPVSGFPVGDPLRPLGSPSAADASQPVAVVLPEPSNGGSPVLVLVVVAGVTMIVVILTGLLVILGSD